ncbi:hypothetical protein AVEN_156379-1 [Araneus ventricosus]|uniref:Uncharacterized protein n=1 Tax=Araneus ventricosus TaxID=182803 RepID=A0A4Y2UMM6_ARAVE|nr:hypothetical protein AVEN_156379-1 [Araneus ventricosus]
MLHHLTPMYISQYPPLDIGNSFCLVVKMPTRDPKVSGSIMSPKWWLADKEHATTTTFSPTIRWQHHKLRQFHLLLHSTDGSTTTPTAMQLSQFKVYDAFHTKKPACAYAQTIGTAICAYARSTSLP